MRSSSAMEPRWVWNSRPGCRMARWRRPLGSVSCACSPGANGPRRGITPDRLGRGRAGGGGGAQGGGREKQGAGGGKAERRLAGQRRPARLGCSHPGEGVVQVGGREHAENLARRFDQQVLGGRGTPYR